MEYVLLCVVRFIANCLKNFLKKNLEKLNKGVFRIDLPDLLSKLKIKNRGKKLKINVNCTLYKYIVATLCYTHVVPSYLHEASHINIVEGIVYLSSTFGIFFDATLTKMNICIRHTATS